MAQGAPKGNEYWRLRSDMSVDGRKLSIAQVEEKLEEYVLRCTQENNYVKDWVGKDAVEVDKPTTIIMSIYGACVHLGIDESTWYDWKKDKKYSKVLARAEMIFKSWNLEGAGDGRLSGNIVSRLDGHKDHKEISDNRDKVSKIFPDESELDE